MELRIGDQVVVSGEATGYGDLEGYIENTSVSDIDHVLYLDIRYTVKSREIANGCCGIHVCGSFVKKSHKESY